MLDSLLIYFSSRSLAGLLRDGLDVGIVYYASYRALLVVRGTRAVQVGLGLSVLLLLYVVARFLELVTVLSIMGTILSSLLLIIVVVFQNDIRRGLQRIGSQAVLGRFARQPTHEVLDEVVEAVTELARHRIGALIAFEQDANLDEFVGVHKGHVIDAAVTRELLVSLFVPEGVNKLHDGAVLIKNLRIAKAGVFFPMPEQRVIDESFGSRHRAAMGITEETDAVVVIVSEERGTISFCFNGNIAPNLDGPKLRTMLEAVFSPKRAQKRAEAARRAAASPNSRHNAGPESGDATVTTLHLEATSTGRFRRDGPELTAALLGRSGPNELRPLAEARTTEPLRVTTVDEPKASLCPSERPPPLRRGNESEPPPPPLRRTLETDAPPVGLARSSHRSPLPALATPVVIEGATGSLAAPRLPQLNATFATPSRAARATPTPGHPVGGEAEAEPSKLKEGG